MAAQHDDSRPPSVDHGLEYSELDAALSNGSINARTKVVDEKLNNESSVVASQNNNNSLESVRFDKLVKDSVVDLGADDSPVIQLSFSHFDTKQTELGEGIVQDTQLTKDIKESVYQNGRDTVDEAKMASSEQISAKAKDLNPTKISTEASADSVEDHQRSPSAYAETPAKDINQYLSSFIPAKDEEVKSHHSAIMFEMEDSEARLKAISDGLMDYGGTTSNPDSDPNTRHRSSIYISALGQSLQVAKEKGRDLAKSCSRSYKKVKHFSICQIIKLSHYDDIIKCVVISSI